MTLRVANCSGFYGDRLSAAREMVEGGPIDVLTGDWLAELTMLILAGNRLKGRPGYAPTFLRQLEEVLGTCLDRGIKIVSNAGGLDPEGCAAAVTDLAARLGLRASVAAVSGDDLTGRDLDLTNADTGEKLDATPLTASAYLGGRPIAAALTAGADVVVTGRVTDAALVTGPGIWRYGWRPTDYDALAGSVAAGHVIECGCQATGGNYAFFTEIPGLAHCGFPIAELEPDGSAVITKHPGTGGAVTVGTVTAQLLYEIGGPRYLGPDVTAHFDTVTLEQEAPDRVRVSGVRGSPPPDTLKVAVNYLGGYRNTMTLMLTGLDLEEKARVAQEAIWARVPREAFDEVDVSVDPPLLRITVMSGDAKVAGRAFSSAVVETGLASYPGFYGLTPPGNASPYGVYWPVLVPAGSVRARVTVDGTPVEVPAEAEHTGNLDRAAAEGGFDGAAAEAPAYTGGPTVRAPLGRVAGARSGDKGGNANLGVWVRSPAQYGWLAAYLTADRLRELLPHLAGYRLDRYELPNLNAVNFVVHGLLGRGVAASPRLDPQAKALGEELRAQTADIPADYLT
ncbi:acyclic terpene utilization AtuA family protein [Nonomuraea sp. NPDC050547]|uniref:acyclic terpene utilization AtuA family protein n=1 Tax=Nonomuraea sp. NPDC050547 TaxID=3364368 RepID=UPI0037B583C6